MDIVEAQMSSHTRDSCLSSHSYVRTVACAMLLICLAEVLGVLYTIAKSIRLVY